MDELMFLEIGSDEWWNRMEGKPRHGHIELEKPEPCWTDDEEQR